MDADAERRLFELLDVVAVAVAGHRAETNACFEQMNARFEQMNARLDETNAQIGSLRHEMHDGFGRVERRLGRIEVRVEDLEAFRSRVERRFGSDMQNP